MTDPVLKNMLPVRSGDIVQRHALVLGYQDGDGRIIVTDVLCLNMPELTSEEVAILSWKLTRFMDELRLGNRALQKAVGL